MVRAWRAIKTSHEDCLVLYRVGEFYEILDGDARIVSRVLGLQLTRRRQKDSDDVPMCGIPAGSLDSMAARLLSQSYKLVVSEPAADPGAGRLLRVLTPGTSVALDVLDPGRPNNLMVARADGQAISFAWMDISTGEAATATASFSGCAAVLARAIPTEILVTSWPEGSAALTQAIRNAAIPMQDLSTRDDVNADDDVSLRATFGDGFRESLRGMGAGEIRALCQLLAYLHRVFGQYPSVAGRPRRDDATDIMEIDSFTLRGLEVLTSGAGRYAALIGVLDRTVTAADRRLLTRQLSAPQANLRRIRQRLGMVRYFVDHPATRSDLQESLSGLPDLMRAAGRLSLRQGGPKDLALIRDGLSIVGATMRHLPKEDDVFAVLARELAASAGDDLRMLVHRLRRGLVREPPAALQDGDVIAVGYDQDLDDLRRQRDEVAQGIEALRQLYAETLGVKSLKIRTNSVIGYHVEIPAQAAEKIDPSVFRLRQGLASATRYTTDALDRLAASQDELGRQIGLVEETRYRDLVGEVLILRGVIMRVAQAAAVLDLVAGLAQAAAEGFWVEPDIHDGVDLAIREGRHPVAENLLEAGGGSFVPNDCVMGADHRMWVITGPNMAGKSTFLRQTALIILMAQIGSFVPAREARIGIVDRMYSRIGAGDDLAAGKSTFMVEMQETATILQEATARSFVILDEIGRGTATLDGLAIAQATMEYLHDVVKCRTLLATHYHELAELADGYAHAVSMMMDAQGDQSAETFSYRMMPGRAGNSYGLRVARMAGVPESVVRRAEEILVERGK